MGGTRFVGRPLVSRLLNAGHELTLFTRGRNPVPAGVEHLSGDRSSDEGLAALQDRPFEVIVDSSGRTRRGHPPGAGAHRAAVPPAGVREFGRGLRRQRALAAG